MESFVLNFERQIAETVVEVEAVETMVSMVFYCLTFLVLRGVVTGTAYCSHRANCDPSRHF